MGEFDNMSASCGSNHTITLSNDGTLYCFGYNGNGELGLGHNYDISIPSQISKSPSRVFGLPKIRQVSCGQNFTVCIDCEGSLWTFGHNGDGQLGTGNKTNF